MHIYKYINKCMYQVFRPVWVRPETPATKTETNISECDGLPETQKKKNIEFIPSPQLIQNLKQCCGR